MAELRQKVAYLEGLVRGGQMGDQRVILEIVQILDMMADLLEEVRERVEDLELGEAGEEEEKGEEVTCPHCGFAVEVFPEDYDEEGCLDLECPECGRSLEEAEEARPVE